MINRLLDRLEEVLIASLLAAGTLIIFVQVVHRFLSTVPHVQDYAIRLDLSWAQEVCIFMFIWVAKFGAAYGVRTGIHVGVDVLVRKLPEKPRNGLILFGLLAGALFTGTIAVLGAQYVYRYHATGQTSEVLEVPMWPIFLCVPLGSALMCYRFLQVAWSFSRTGELPHHDHGHVEGLEEVEPLLVGQALEEGEAISRRGGGKGGPP